jgi:YT521-B-like domain
VAVGGTFQIRWERVADLSFADLHGITNPLNDDKPLSLCRDGQELPADIGATVVKMINRKEERPPGRGFVRGGSGSPPAVAHGIMFFFSICILV